MTGYELKNIDPEDFEDFLMKVEDSFHITFVGDELVYITTFGQLCDHIANKIQLDHSNDCTSQQAFYKLRAALSSQLQIDHKAISTDTFLSDLLPVRIRRSRIKKLERQLGFKLGILRPPRWVTGTLAILALSSLVGLFLNWQIGFLGLAISITGYWFAHKTGNVLDLQTVGQVAEKMTRENYLKSRLDSKTFNKNEIEKILTDWLSDELDLDKSKLTREAKLV